MELKDRLKSARKAKGITQAQVAEHIKDLTQSAYSQLESGKSKSTTKAVELAQLFGVNINWLATGEGEMTPSFDPTKLAGYAVIETWDDSTPLEEDEVEIPFYKDLAFACGHGAEGVAYDNEWRKLRFSRMTLNRLGVYRDNTFAATARDDSMMPTINDGDTIFVDRGRNHIKDGKIFAIEHGGLFYCKRLYKLPNGGVRVVSDNSDEFPEYIVTREEMADFIVIGWVYSISRLERW